MKGGISYITKIFSEAIIEYMQSYDDKTSKYITYLMQIIYMVGQ